MTIRLQPVGGRGDPGRGALSPQSGLSAEESAEKTTDPSSSHWTFPSSCRWVHTAIQELKEPKLV